MKSKSLAKDLAGCTKEILGTAQSIGRTIDGRPTRDIIDNINSGETGVSEESSDIIPARALKLNADSALSLGSAMMSGST
ncbi:60S ribosomal protein L12 [Mycena venus]|uniref:60S ribosomal protein L12 n=1 Tax=Mycena venus TaxID=2733690 RepID=A0A8H6Y223_9AGAR|nr:60S ribosomal protein L12 [Mycena venus]